MTRLDYAAGNTAIPIETWGTTNLAKEPVTIGGTPATRFTVRQRPICGGGTGVSLRVGRCRRQAGHVAGVRRDDEPGAGTVERRRRMGTGRRLVRARIVSGPGRVETQQAVGGLWRVADLSQTEATRVEDHPRYDQGTTGTAYIYGDLEGEYRSGISFVASDVGICAAARRPPPIARRSHHLEHDEPRSHHRYCDQPARRRTSSRSNSGDTSSVSKSFAAKANRPTASSSR
ncbi:hypothetical protein AB5I41_23560 [Sphingomonas sp. MMS24-JH45]